MSEIESETLMDLLKQEANLFAFGIWKKILCCYQSSFLDALGKDIAHSNVNSLEANAFKSHDYKLVLDFHIIVSYGSFFQIKTK